MKKTVLLLTSMILLSFLTKNAPAFEGDQSLVCYFHDTLYNIVFIEEGILPGTQCGIPSQDIIDNTPTVPGHIHKIDTDVHDPECFSWVHQ